MRLAELRPVEDKLEPGYIFSVAWEYYSYCILVKENSRSGQLLARLALVVLLLRRCFEDIALDIFQAPAPRLREHPQQYDSEARHDAAEQQPGVFQQRVEEHHQRVAQIIRDKRERRAAVVEELPAQQEEERAGTELEA